MLTTGHVYMESMRLAEERLESYHRDAATYRSTEYDRYHSVTRAFCTRLGDLLLAWGRSLRERSGDVNVEIAFQPRRERRNAA